MYLTSQVVAGILTTQYTFNPDTGTLSSTTDPNNILTSYQYDSLGRQKLEIEASGQPVARQTVTAYDDVNRRVAVRRDLKNAGDGGLVTVTAYDQLGRVRLTKQLEAFGQNEADDVSGIKVQTRYLASGTNRYQFVSNPFRDTGEATMGWTLTTFDQDSRPISVKYFTGAALPSPGCGNTNTTGTVTTAYSEQTTTVTDQAGEVRVSTLDALGRLVGVVEDPSGLNYATAYTYDALSNLGKVTQGAQTRTFNYDSLSQLQYATEPESATTNYRYDAAGNLQWRSDAAGIQACYQYDVLNRPVRQVYYKGNVPQGMAGQCDQVTSGRVPPTETTFLYDDASVPFSKGRLTQVGASGVSLTKTTGYDALGRATGSYQNTSNTTFAFSYQYNLADSLVAEVLPSGRQAQWAYDGANRAQQVTGLRSGERSVYADQITYAPQGEMKKTLATVTTVDALDLTYTWGTTTANNGNLSRQQENTASGALFNNLLNLAQNYRYDALNRINYAEETNGIPVQWNRSYDYDRYGNQWVSNPSMSLPATQPSDIRRTARSLVSKPGQSNSFLTAADPGASGLLLRPHVFVVEEPPFPSSRCRCSRPRIRCCRRSLLRFFLRHS